MLYARHPVPSLDETVPAAVQAREFVRRMAGQAPTAAVATRRRVLSADAEGLRVPVVDEPPPRVPIEGVPAGWDVHEFKGRADVELVRGERGLALRLRSTRASFALHRDLVVDLEEFPILTWSWRVSQLPLGGDVRERRRDDQAAQVYVVFPRWPSPRTQSDVVGYVWDTNTPTGTTLTGVKASNVKIIVVESGTGGLGSWQRYRRDLATDYQQLFGRPAPRVGAIAFMIDADDTASSAEALFGEVAFLRRTASEKTKTPTSMLR